MLGACSTEEPPQQPLFIVDPLYSWYLCFGVQPHISTIIDFLCIQFLSLNNLRQLGSLLVERLDHVSHILHRVQRALVSLVDRRLLKHNKASGALV